MRVKILVGLMFFSLIVPSMTLAASTDLAPEFNMMCWRKEECEKTRAEILNKTIKEVQKDSSGWIQHEDPCNAEGWGKCLPAGTTVTEISFGGQKKFENIGDFLKTNYNLALTIAGILAVIMIIIAGVQWVTSGGNSEMITGAKKRISGALTGLLIAYLSYTILNTVNPALTNLRLPQNFLIRPSKLTPQFCKDASEGSKFALASKKGEKVDKEKMKDPNLKMEALTPSQMGCGDNFFLEGGGGATCMGGGCSEKGQTCMPFSFNGDQIINQPNCLNAQMIVHYTIDPGVTGLLKNLTWWTSDIGSKDWLDDNIFDFRPVCKRVKDNSSLLYIGDMVQGWDNKGDRFDFHTIKKSPFFEYYAVINKLSTVSPNPAYDHDHWGCKGTDVLEGFVLKNEMDKASGWFGGSDANFFASNKFTGSWYSISKNGYVSQAELDGGVIVNATLGDDAISYMVNHTGILPSKFTVDGTPTGDQVNADSTVTQDALFEQQIKKDKSQFNPMNKF